MKDINMMSIRKVTRTEEKELKEIFNSAASFGSFPSGNEWARKGPEVYTPPMELKPMPKKPVCYYPAYKEYIDIAYYQGNFELAETFSKNSFIIAEQEKLKAAAKETEPKPFDCPNFEKAIHKTGMMYLDLSGK